MIKDMDKQFNFDLVGKQMPYNVPEGFFEQLEKNVMADVKVDDTATEKPKFKARAVRMAIRAFFATAAAVALFFVVTKYMPSDTTTTQDSFANMELAYNNLSTEDQEYLMEVYEEDVFLEENEEMDY